MLINVYCIEKNNDEFRHEINQYIKMSSKWAKIADINKFNQLIAKAHNISPTHAQNAYENEYLKCLDGFCVILDELGEELNSFEFAKLLENHSKISFFIGGAYGFSQDFKNKADKIISLSRFTLAHKIAKLILFEQIFRALSINSNHPYHKG